MSARTIKIYKTKDQKEPFNDWLKKVKDKRDQMRIRRRIDRLEAGLFGDCERLSSDLYELKCHFGHGYRIYYTEYNETIVVLLLGGIKRSQTNDISKAQMFAKDLKEKHNE